MTSIEYLKMILKDYEKNAEIYKDDEKIRLFWKGACFSLKIAIDSLYLLEDIKK